MALEWDGIISMEDLSPRQQEMAKVIGVEAYIKLTKHFGGESAYIPKFDEMVKDPRNREIRQKYNGYNSTALAREYCLSDRYVRMLTYDIRRERQTQPIENQLRFEDLK